MPRLKLRQKTKAQLQAGAKLANGFSKFDPSGSLLMASIAMQGLATFGVSDLADNIQYWITDQQNAGLFMAGQAFNIYYKGNGPLCYRQMKPPTAPLAGMIYLCLLNDNQWTGIDVHIRMGAVVVSEQWGQRTVRKYKVNTSQQPYLAGN